MPATGRASANRRASEVSTPRKSSSGIAETRLVPLSHAEAASFGNSRIALKAIAEQDRDDDQHPRGHEQPRPALQGGRLVPLPRQQALERRAHVRVEVRHAGRVGEDVVAVGADHGREVLDDLQHLDRDQQQQRLDPGRQPHAERDHRDEGVEVDAAQVGAQAGAPRQPVGVGDVGVEGRPDEVDAGAHAAGLAAAVAAGRRVADLVEGRRGDRQAEDEQQQLGVLERLGGRRRDALVDQDEPADGEERDHRREEHPGPEQQLERPRDRPGDLRVREEDLPAQRQQRVRARRRLVLEAGEQPLLRRASRRS